MVINKTVGHAGMFGFYWLQLWLTPNTRLVRVLGSHPTVTIGLSGKRHPSSIKLQCYFDVIKPRLCTIA